MLGLPETDFSDPKSAIKLDALQIADWIEGSITFADQELSQSDVVDVLKENYLTTKARDQSANDLAVDRVKQTWQELHRRAGCLGAAASYEVDGPKVKRTQEWEHTPGFAFCLIVALLPAYRTAFRQFRGYTEQGQIFERLTQASLSALGWQVHNTGWSKSASDSIESKIQAVAEFLRVDPMQDASKKWLAPKAKDAGLDLICQYEFKDGWGGKPIILTQCASGDNWEDKLHTPNLKIWNKLLDMHAVPARGLAMPFAIRKDRFHQASVTDEFALLLDRHRLAVPGKKPKEWIPNDLNEDILKWMKKRVTVLLATAS